MEEGHEDEVPDNPGLVSESISENEKDDEKDDDKEVNSSKK